MAPLLNFILAPPLRSCRFSAVAKPRSRASPGISRALERSDNLPLGFHALHRPFCNFGFRSSSVLPSAPLQAQVRPLSVPPDLYSSATCSVLLAHLDMPRLHPRMSCRRGSSRGRVTRKPSSSTSDSSSETSDFSSDRYPVTRSGRGRGRGQHNTAARSQNSQSHIARFRFPCTFSNSSFIASVTIELREDTSGSVAVTPGASLETRVEDKQGIYQTNNTQSKDPGGSATQDTNIKAGLSVPTGGGSLGKEGQPSEDEDPYKYGCRIVEESPSTSHED